MEVKTPATWLKADESDEVVGEDQVYFVNHAFDGFLREITDLPFFPPTLQ